MRQVDPEADFTRKLESAAEVETIRAKTGVKASGQAIRNAHGLAMDARTYGIGAQILFDLGVRQLNLLTNHPKRIQGLEGYGLKIKRQTPLLGSGSKSLARR
jgi:GTP cyclohydrolase II